MKINENHWKIKENQRKSNGNQRKTPENHRKSVRNPQGCWKVLHWFRFAHCGFFKNVIRKRKITSQRVTFFVLAKKIRTFRLHSRICSFPREHVMSARPDFFWKGIRNIRGGNSENNKIRFHENLRNHWKSLKIFENHWKSLKINENQRKSKEITENRWKSLKIQKIK